MSDLLYEIGTEEIPAGYLQPALRRLVDEFAALLAANGLEARSVRGACTPRRLTLAAGGLPEAQAARRTKVVGPPASAAFDRDGRPTPAAHGFARSKGVPVESLQIEQSRKGPYVAAVVEEPGRPAGEVVPGLLAQATAGLRFPKSMRWESGGATFARPIRWLVALLRHEVLPLEIAGVHADRRTRGHRFLAPGEIELRDASYEDYRAALRRAYVIVDDRERRDILKGRISAILGAHGSELRDEALLDDVTGMVEWPHAVEGSFDDAFLAVPAPVLVAAMKGHQYDFPVWGADGRLRPRFVAVSDRTEEHDDLVRAGNERVLRARLDDARFFWEHDRGRPLDELVPRLEGVVFLGGLGTNLQRTERLAGLSVRIAQHPGGGAPVEHVQRAARLCKADLLTGLVGEFPALQGVVGGEIARVQGEPEPVARAVAEHYRPAGPDDALPETPAGRVLALADKLDVIVGCFAIGLLPSGSQDPYGLRRGALGILRILERDVAVPYEALLRMAVETYREHGVETSEEARAALVAFVLERLEQLARDRGFRHDFVAAVRASGWRRVDDFWRRLEALVECATRPWWPELVELVDRTHRITSDDGDGAELREDLLSEPLERQLAAALAEHAGGIRERFAAGDYVGGAEAGCAAFARLVHEFFDQVFINVEDRAVRANRKALCRRVCTLFSHNLANLYWIQTTEGQGESAQSSGGCCG
ncbi:MAG: glycine--tRNA ligase subunit beta [Candidatus Brocadiaceae bacterium]|nr:glycine--tRNA ligase subunit beta [Candidatus Brocadiaceae bacterium]